MATAGIAIRQLHVLARVRAGGMERPTDAYKKTHNLVVARRDTTFGGQVSRLQVAELVAASLVTSDLAANKVGACTHMWQGRAAVPGQLGAGHA